MKKRWKVLINVVASLAIVFCVALIVVRSVTAGVIVDGSSMAPTLHDLDYGEMITASLKKKNIRRFDIIIFRDSNDAQGVSTTLIKRVIALPGEEVMIDSETGDLSINEQIVEQSFISKEKQMLTCSNAVLACDTPYLVPESHFFVLGDNRNQSRDSAHGLGVVNQSVIQGVLWYINATCESIKTDYDQKGQAHYTCVNKKSTKVIFF